MRFQNQKLAGFDGRQSAEGFGLDPTLGGGRLRERPRATERSDGNIHYSRRPRERRKRVGMCGFTGDGYGLGGTTGMITFEREKIGSVYCRVPVHARRRSSEEG